MAQVTTGLRAVLSHPRVYQAFQRLMGPPTTRRNFVAQFIRPAPGMAVLDVGCGPADILDELPAVEYHGFDISPAYIDHARDRYGDRGRFTCKLLEPADLAQLPKFDVVLALGLLHHLDDADAIGVLRLAASALKPGGRLATIDPVIAPGQNPIARFLVKRDRGQNVRTQQGYARLGQAVFASVRAEVRHQAWVPYSHCMMECSLTPEAPT